MTGPRIDDDAEFEAWKKKRAKVATPSDTAPDDDAEFEAWRASRATTDSTPRLDPAQAATATPTATPAPRRGIADALGDLMEEAKGFVARHAPSLPAPDPSALNPLGRVYTEGREERTITHAAPPQVRMQSTAEYAREAQARPMVPKLDVTQRPDVADAAGVARTRGTRPGETQTVAEDRQRRLQVARRQQATEKENFSPERLTAIADAGMKRAAELRAEGKLDEAAEFERLSQNTRLTAENASEADTFGAIALSNLLGLVGDPYAQQRRNLAEAAAPGALFTPEQTQELIGERVAPARGFDTAKDLAAPLVGQLPLFVATGAAGRLATGAAGAYAEARGARSIGQALTRLSQLGEDATAVGPRVPVRSIPLARARIAEEIAEFRAAVPSMVARGVTEGQAVGAALTYKQVREQGGSVEDAISAAAEGVPLNVLMGVVGETLIAGAGKALGLGFDPVGRVLRDIKAGRGLEDAHEVARPTDRRPEVQQREVGKQRAALVEMMDDLLGTKRAGAIEEEQARAEAARVERQRQFEEVFGGADTRPADAAWWETHLPPEQGEGLIEPGSALRPRDENPPLRSAREIAMEQRPIDRFNAVKRMEHERAALREQLDAEANDPNLRLERAAQEAPDRVQGPRTLRETLADVGPAAEQGDELAGGYTKAINDYVDALSAVQDTGEKGPNTRMQVKLARARQALNAARKQYGAQLGASAVLALAVANSELTDDEKALVGLATVPLVTRSRTHHLGVLHEILGDMRASIARVDDDPNIGMGVQAWMDRIRRAEPLLAENGGLTEIEAALYDRARQTSGGTLTPADVQTVLTPEPFPEDAALYSRLRRLVTNREVFGKKWEEPRPAADWIGKLKGSNAIARKELDLILPALEAAAQEKRKVDRAMVLDMIETHTPRIERITLTDDVPKRPKGDMAEVNRAIADVDDGDPNGVEDLDVILDDEQYAGYPRAERLRDQLAHRRARIAEIDEEIERLQEGAYEEMAAAERMQQQRYRELQQTLEGAGLSPRAADEAIQYIDDHTYGGDEPANVEKAMEKIADDLLPDVDYERLLQDDDYTVGEEPEWSVELRYNGHEGSYRQTVTYDDLFEVEGGIVDAVTLDEVRAALEEYYSARDVTVRDVEERGSSYVVRNRKGKRVAWSDYKDDAMREAVESEGLGPDMDELYGRVMSDLEDYANARAEWMRAESDHYDLTENVSERFEEELNEKERLEQEMPTLEEAYAAAQAAAERQAVLEAETGRRRALEAAGQETLLAEPDAETTPEPVPEPEPEDEPIQPKVHGSPKYATYQRIGGGTNYRELPSVVENHRGDPYDKNHYASSARLKNVGAHARVEEHQIHATPGLTGPEVEYTKGEPEDIRVLKSKIGEVRKKRAEALKVAGAIANEYENLPAARQRDDAVRRSYMQRFETAYQHVADQGTREDELAEELRNLYGRLLGYEDPGPRKAHVMVESQMDWAQDATKYGIMGRVDAARAEKANAELEAVIARRDALLDAEEKAHVRSRAAAQAWKELRNAIEVQETPEARALAGDFNEAMTRAYATGMDVTADLSDLNPSAFLDAGYETEVRWLEDDPRTAEIVRGYRSAVNEAETARAERLKLDDDVEELETERQAALGIHRNAVPAGPFVDTATAAQLNGARLLVDVAEREPASAGNVLVAWSDSDNRIANAWLPPKAARLVYDDLTGSAVKRLLGFLGFKDVKIEKVWIKGNGHWAFEMTPEMRKAIRKYGLPILGVMAFAPATAEAQGESGSSVNPYASLIGGVAIGAALMYLADHRAARRLVHENRELARIVEMDDLSGLANKRAWDRARPNVDADEDFGVVAMDGDAFGQLNKKRGHSAGDKAIKHFGEVLRQASVELEIPLRAFRKGGDEFVYAAPKAKLADLARYIERHSTFTDGNVTTRLSAAFGDTFEEADAVLIALKEARRRGTPALDRALDEIDRMKAKVQNEQTVRLGMGGRIDMGTLHANPVGLALQAIRRSPTAASIAALGVALGSSDDADLKATSPYMLGLAALSAIGSGPLLAGKDALVKRTVEMMRSVGGESLVRAFNPEALLDPSVKDAIAQYEKDRARAVARAREMSAKAKGLGPEGDRAVSDILEGEGWEDTSGFTPELMNNVLAVASALEAEYSASAAEQIASGARTPEQMLPVYGGPRRYAAIEAEAVQRDRPGYVPPRSTRIGELKRRTLDIPIREAEQALSDAQASGDPAAIQAARDRLDEANAVQMSRRVELGEIREQSYRAAQGIEAGYANAAAARLFATLRNVPGVVHPEFDRLLGELKAAKAMLASATTQADRDAATQLVQQATFDLDKLTKQFQRKKGQAPGDYVSLADSPGLGELRGAVVKRDVAHSITGFSDKTAYTKLLQQWKELKTIFNVGTHIANIVSNFTFAHMEGLLLHQQPAYLKRALSDMKKYGDATRALAEGGVLDQNVVTATGSSLAGREMRSIEGLDELRPTTRPETRTVLEEHGLTAADERRRKRTARLKGAAAGAVVGAAALANDEHPEDMGLGAAAGAGIGAAVVGRGRGVRKLYNNEDNIFRVAIYLKKIDDGMSKDDALRYAQSALGHFRTRSPALNLVRTTLAPFILYPAKAVPRFTRQMIDHPWRYVALMSAWAALNEYAERDEGEVSDSDLPIKDRTQSKWGYFFPGFTQLPTQDEQGNKGATDIARWTPMSGVTTGTPPGSVTGTINEKLPAILQPSGPVADAVAKLYGNVDPTTGRPRIKPDYPVGENISTLLNDASELALPPALGFHRKRLQEDVENRDFAKFRTDILGPTGLRPRFVRPGANISAALHQLETSLSDMEYDFKRELRNNKDSRPERTQALVDRYLRRRKSAIDNFTERTGSPPPAEVRPPEME